MKINHVRLFKFYAVLKRINSEVIAQKMPLVSIIIPVYNQELPFFQEALNSALNQTYSSIEVVVSNNHSTNEITQYLDTVKDQRLKIVKPATFLPISEHFYFAGEHAKGEYITFLSSDDWLYPDCIESLILPILNKKNIILSFGEVVATRQNNLNHIRSYYNHRSTGIRTADESLNELINARPAFAWLPGGIISKAGYQYVKSLFLQEAHTAIDVSILIKAHEIGDVFYENNPVGKFRVWSHAEGKKGGVPLIPYIKGISAIAQLIEESPVLMSYLKNGMSDMQNWRKFQSKRWAMATLTDYATGSISTKMVKQALQAIHETLYPPTIFTKTIALISRKPISWLSKPTFNILYRSYLYLQGVMKKTL